MLLRATPNLIRPFTFVLPHSPEQRPAWLIRLDLSLYDHPGGREILVAPPGPVTAGARRGSVGWRRWEAGDGPQGAPGAD